MCCQSMNFPTQPLPEFQPQLLRELPFHKLLCSVSDLRFFPEFHIQSVYTWNYLHTSWRKFFSYSRGSKEPEKNQALLNSVMLFSTDSAAKQIVLVKKISLKIKIIQVAEHNQWWQIKSLVSFLKALFYMA